MEEPPPAHDRDPTLRVVLTNCPPGRASQIARELIEARLAACVNRIDGVTSTYWWEGEVVEDQESTLLIKTTASAHAALVDRLRRVHPYDVPEIVTLRPEDVLAAYGEWALGATTGPARASAGDRDEGS